ncbi:MAG: DUF2188 domain-containing protein [Oscillospiraceae bacterium]
MGKNQHVTPHPDGGWQVKGAGNSKATIRTNTQAEAIAVAREIARNQESELIIHGMNGRIRERDSYGNDPYPPKG